MKTKQLILFFVALTFIFSQSIAQNTTEQPTPNSLKAYLLSKWDFHKEKKMDSLLSVYQENKVIIRHFYGNVTGTELHDKMKKKEVHIVSIEPYGEINAIIVEGNIGILSGQAKYVEMHKGKLKTHIVDFSNVCIFKNNQWVDLVWHSSVAP